MKVIHTHALIDDRTFYKTNLYHMLISLFSAKHVYGNVELYTDKFTYDKIKDLEFPYDEIHVIEEFNSRYNKNEFSIPKLHTYTLQTEPFIHIDIDTFLLKDLEIEQHNEVVFAHDDYTLVDFNRMLDPKGRYKSIDYQALKHLNSAYLGSLLKLDDVIPREILDRTRFDFIPNFCVFGGYNTDLIKETSQHILKIHEKNVGRFKVEESSPQILEQLLFFPTLSYITNDEIKTYWGEHHGCEPFFLRIKKLTEKYPFIINNPTDNLIQIESHGKVIMEGRDERKRYPNWVDNGKTVFYNPELVNNMLSYPDYGSFIHLGGLKGCDSTNEFIISYFMKRFKNLKDYDIFIDRMERIRHGYFPLGYEENAFSKRKII